MQFSKVLIACAVFFASSALASPSGPVSASVTTHTEISTSLLPLNTSEVPLDLAKGKKPPKTTKTSQPSKTPTKGGPRPKGQIFCQNNEEKLTGDAYAKKGCDPDQSKGFLSSHNCKDKGGKAYYCVINGQGSCISGGALKRQNMEKGECFL